MLNKIIIIVCILVFVTSILAIMSLNRDGKSKFKIMVVGEKGEEYIIPTWMMQREDVRNVVAQLEKIRTSKQ